MLRDWLQSCLQEDLGKLKDIAFMGKGFYHVTMMPEMNICKIVESSPRIWHNARDYVFNWDTDLIDPHLHYKLWVLMCRTIETGLL